MAFDFDIFLKQKAYACVDTAIGKLCIFSINLKDQTNLYRKLGVSISECTTSNFIMNFCIYTCFPIETLEDNLYKPETTALTENDVNKISNENFEEIAGVYIENNSYLFKGNTVKNEKGEASDYESCKEIEHPRIDGESNSSYLHRLFIIENERHAKLIDGLSGFSSKLTDDIKNTLDRGDLLSKSMESIQSISRYNTRLIEQDPPSIDFNKINQDNEERRLRPFNDLSTKLDQLIASSADASVFMVEANKIQTQIAVEIKSSGDATTRFSKWNIILSCMVIVLTLAGLLLTGYSIVSGGTTSQEQQVKLQKSADSIVNSLTDINENLTRHKLQEKVMISTLEKVSHEQNYKIIELQKKIEQLEKMAEEYSKVPSQKEIRDATD